MPRGRVPDEGVKRDTPLCVRFTAADVEKLDKARGNTSRSKFVRDAARGAFGAKGAS